MIPKEKAKELIEKFEFVYVQNYTSMFEVKQCAVIAVDEILKLELNDGYDHEYWQEVKQ